MLTVVVRTATEMRALGARLAGLLRAGDLVVVAGALGAGKTTLAQGVGAGLEVREPVRSPTFVIAREHRGRLPFLHVDAYRLERLAEVDDLDLDSPMADAVTLVEWGRGLVDELAADRLEVDIEPVAGDGRMVTVRGVGGRWVDVDLRPLAAG